MTVAVTSANDDLIPAVSYARQSADLKKDQHGIKEQHKINRRTAARHGMTIVREISDNDKSAAKAEVVRDGFEEMLKAIKAGRLSDGTIVNGVVVTVDDRLVRRSGDYERFVDAFTHADGRVFADQRGLKDLYSVDVESMGLLGAVMGRIEVRKIQRRMRSGHRRRAEAGIPAGGYRPFGWQADRLTLEPVEAALLRQAGIDVLSGRSLYSIVREWRPAGVKTPRGGDWTFHALKTTLQRPRICGYRELNGELVRGEDGNPVIGRWESILEPDQWQGIRAIFDARRGHFVNRYGEPMSAHTPDYRDPAHLLSAFARCGNTLPDGVRCNTPVRVTHGKASHHSYTCRTKVDGGCSGVSRRGDLVDMYVSEALLARLEEGGLTAAPAGEWEGEAELATARDKLQALTAQWSAEKISNELFFQLAPEKEAQINRLRTEKARYEAANAAHQVQAETTIAELRRRWYLPEDDGGLPISVKRTYIRKALHTVIIYPAGRGNKKFDPDLIELIWREN